MGENAQLFFTASASVKADDNIYLRRANEASDTVWTCDFSHDYVSINADYRS